jgi:hypothetical protein
MGSTALVLVMVVMMVVMCGGIIAGDLWGIRRRRQPPHI